LRWHFLVFDIGFFAYWIITAFGLLPHEWAFKDYSNPVVVAWNWSFLPIDLVLSLVAAAALVADRMSAAQTARSLAVISLSLTHASGLMALSYWAFRGEVDFSWWVPNGYLLLYPLCYVRWACKPLP
jgi:uncharacterized protein DUF5360